MTMVCAEADRHIEKAFVVGTGVEDHVVPLSCEIPMSPGLLVINLVPSADQAIDNVAKGRLFETQVIPEFVEIRRGEG